MSQNLDKNCGKYGQKLFTVLSRAWPSLCWFPWN